MKTLKIIVGFIFVIPMELVLWGINVIAHNVGLSAIERISGLALIDLMRCFFIFAGINSDEDDEMFDWCSSVIDKGTRNKF